MTAFPTGGVPGVRSSRTATPRRVLLNDAGRMLLPTSLVIDGSKSRDPGNTGDVDVLRAGMVMGKITSSGKFAPSILGQTGIAITNSTTSLTSTPAGVVTELVRRVGSTGTFKIIGPPTAAGTVRTLTATYSAASGTTITITALGVNEVQTLTFDAAATGGTMKLTVPKADGTPVTTAAITWNATDATWLANINSALDTATGVTGGIVATGAAPDTALTFTFSGTGYAGLPQPTRMIEVQSFPTSASYANTVRTTTGVDGRFVTGSLIVPTDGSETPLALINDGYGIKVTDEDGTSVDTAWPNVLVGGLVKSDQIVNWPADTSTRAWLVAQLALVGGGFCFSHLFS